MLKGRQQAILDFIRQEVKEKGYPPSVREIGEAVGLASSSTVHGHLSRLEKKGYIRRDSSKPRALELLDLDIEPEVEEIHTVRIPVIGKVTAGEPILAVENMEEYFVLPESMVGSGTLYMLRIQGNSMIEAGILDGDYVIVRQQSTAVNGDKVIAMTEDGEATCKTFYKEKDYIRLQPENSSMEPIILSNVSILGKVVGVFRNIH